MVRITLAAFRSRPAVCPQDSHRKVRSPSPGRSLFLAKHSEQVIVVQAGGTSTTFRPARWPHSVRARLAAPIAASAALRAIVDLARNSDRKSSTAMVWWLSTTRLAQTRAAWVFCRAAFFCSFAASRLARRYPLDGACPRWRRLRAIFRWALASSAAQRFR